MLIERRQWIRFPLRLAASVKQKNIVTAGTTVNVSGRGVLIHTDSKLRKGTTVEAHLEWPVPLADCNLKLVMSGVIVWTEEFLTAIEAKQYEFRTVSRRKSSSIEGATAVGLAAVQLAKTHPQ
jgi:hypothetical protein